MATNIQKNSARLMLSRLQGELDNLFNKQETLKAKKGFKENKLNDKIPQMPWGGLASSLTGFANQARTGMTQGWNKQLAGAAGVLGNMDWSGKDDKEGWDWGKIGKGALYGTAALAPSIFNIGRGLSKPTEYNASDYYNPYRGDIRSAMKDRRYDAGPQYEANRRAQAAYNRNITKSGAISSGELRSNQAAGLAARMRADFGVGAHKSNIENQYLAEQAQMDYGLGNQMAGVNWQVDLAEEQNRAARGTMLGAGLTGISDFTQMNKLMANQKRTSELFATMLPEGMPAMEWMPKFMEWLNTIKGK